MDAREVLVFVSISIWFDNCKGRNLPFATRYPGAKTWCSCYLQVSHMIPMSLLRAQDQKSNDDLSLSLSFSWNHLCIRSLDWDLTSCLSFPETERFSCYTFSSFVYISKVNKCLCCPCNCQAYINWKEEKKKKKSTWIANCFSSRVPVAVTELHKKQIDLWGERLVFVLFHLSFPLFLSLSLPLSLSLCSDQDHDTHLCLIPERDDYTLGRYCSSCERRLVCEMELPPLLVFPDIDCLSFDRFSGAEQKCFQNFSLPSSSQTQVGMMFYIFLLSSPSFSDLSEVVCLERWRRGRAINETSDEATSEKSLVFLYFPPQSFVSLYFLMHVLHLLFVSMFVKKVQDTLHKKHLR